MHSEIGRIYIRLTHLVVSSQRIGAVRSRKDYLMNVRRIVLNSCA